MRENIEPFRLRIENCKTTLYLYGTANNCEEGNGDIIIEAISEGHDIDIRYVTIIGGLLIRENDYRFAYNSMLDGNSKIIIASSISIKDCDIIGDVNCISVIFNEIVDFSRTNFVGRACFYKARICGLSSFDGVHFSSNPELSKACLKDLSPSSFEELGEAYKNSLLSGAGYFFEHAGKKFLVDNEYHRASDSFRNAKVEYEKESKYDEAAIMFRNVGEQYLNLKNYSLAANCFREAKIEYDKEGNHRESSAMYVKEMKCIKENSRWWKNYLYWFWEITCNYGESWLRFASWVFGILMFFACIYLPSRNDLGVFDIEFDNYQYSDYVGNKFFTALYLSISTFASFGDLQPVNDAGKFWVSFELILGYLMFGVLITLVARKMTRS